MKKWKQHACQHGNGARCCQHLVTNGKIHVCNKIKKRGKTFSPIPGAMGDNCLTGVPCFRRMDAALQKHQKNYALLGFSF
jgi:hypothetical protein